MTQERPGQRVTSWSAPTSLTVLANFAGVLAVLGTAAYVAGAVTLLIYFRRADVPALQALALQEPRFVVATGLTELFLPAVIVGLATVVLVVMLRRAASKAAAEARAAETPARLTAFQKRVEGGTFVLLILWCILVVRAPVSQLWLYIIPMAFLLTNVGSDLTERLYGPRDGHVHHWRVGLTVAPFMVLIAVFGSLVGPNRLETVSVKDPPGTEVTGTYVSRSGDAWYVGTDRALVVVPVSDAVGTISKRGPSAPPQSLREILRIKDGIWDLLGTTLLTGLLALGLDALWSRSRRRGPSGG